MLGKPDQIEALWITRADWLKGWIYFDRGKYEQSKEYFNSFFNSFTPNKKRTFSFFDHNVFDFTFFTALKYFYFGVIDLEMGKIDSVRMFLIHYKQIFSIG